MNSGESSEKRKRSDESSEKLKKSIEEMDDGSKSVSKLRQFARELSKSLEEPIGSLNILSEIRPSSIAPPFTISTYEGQERSPARTLMDYYRMLTDLRNEDYTWRRSPENPTRRSMRSWRRL